MNINNDDDKNLTIAIFYIGKLIATEMRAKIVNRMKVAYSGVQI